MDKGNTIDTSKARAGCCRCCGHRERPASLGVWKHMFGAADAHTCKWAACKCGLGLSARAPSTRCPCTAPLS
eukprot:2199038-Alexandrium_andersonii.AAC.1